MNIYVRVNGNDIDGDGSINNPFLTLSKCLSVAVCDDTVYIGEGVYTTTYLYSLTKADTYIKYIGVAGLTTIEIKGCPTNESFRYGSLFQNIIFRASNSFTGDTRALSYTSDSNEVIFKNCLFKKSLNNSYPTSTTFYVHYNNDGFQSNKTFINCTFACPGNPSGCGSARFKNCATIGSAFQGRPTETNVVGSYTNIKLDTNYNNTMSGIGYDSLKLWLYNTKTRSYYTIENNNIVEIGQFDAYRFFNIKDIKNIKNNKNKFNLTMFKLVTLFEFGSNNSLYLKDDTIGGFLLIDLSKLNIDNIKLNDNYNFMLSNDLLKWDVYYDSENYNSIAFDKYDIELIKKELINRSKSINFVNKKYNYILIYIDKNINALYSNKTINKKLSNNRIQITGEKISYTSNIDSDIDINKLETNRKTISSINGMN